LKFPGLAYFLEDCHVDVTDAKGNLVGRCDVDKLSMFLLLAGRAYSKDFVPSNQNRSLQLLDKMIPAQRLVPLKSKNPGYYVQNESEIDRYVRSSGEIVTGAGAISTS
jgi:hypothetical protein